MAIWDKSVARLTNAPYWIALGLVGLSVTVAFLATIYAINAQHRGLKVAELAKRQRLSGQEIVLLAGELASAPAGKLRQTYRSELQSTIRGMERRHEILSPHEQPERIPADMLRVLRDIYFSELLPFDEEVHRFLRDAKAIAEADDSDLRPDMPAVDKLTEASTENLMSTHGLVYRLLREDALATLKRTKWFAGGMWLLTLLLIILEVPLIFRPMAGRTAEALRSLDAARQSAVEGLAAQRRHEARVVFMRIMRHELITPLNAILGIVQLLRVDSLPPKQSAYIDQLEQAARQLVHLVKSGSGVRGA